VSEGCELAVLLDCSGNHRLQGVDYRRIFHNVLLFVVERFLSLGLEVCHDGLSFFGLRLTLPFLFVELIDLVLDIDEFEESLGKRLYHFEFHLVGLLDLLFP
jgi:hypothetical protein